MTENCYRFEKIYFENGILQEQVDATYIIHLEGNGRYEEIQKQLHKFHPTNVVYIVFNKGFKNCKKMEDIDKSSLDLIDAFLQTFKHAKKQNYKNILVLEDDFMFDDKIKEKQHKENICNFLKSHEDEDFMYFLGCLPWIQLPYNYYHNRNLLSTGTHSCIYSKKFRQRLLNINQTDITDWDFYNTFALNRYAYYAPLCYQLFPDTENSNNWCSKYTFIICKFVRTIFNVFKLDIYAQPGYNIFYIVSKLWFFIFLFIILFIFTRKFKKTTRTKNFQK